MKKIFYVLTLSLFIFTVSKCASGPSGTYADYKNSKFIMQLKTKSDELVDLQVKLLDLSLFPQLVDHPSITTIEKQIEVIKNSINETDSQIFSRLYLISLAEKIVELEAKFNETKDTQQKTLLENLIKKVYNLIPPKDKDNFYQIKRQIIKCHQLPAAIR